MTEARVTTIGNVHTSRCFPWVGEREIAFEDDGDFESAFPALVDPAFGRWLGSLSALLCFGIRFHSRSPFVPLA